MKVIRKILVFILGLILFNLCISLVLSFAVKEVFQKNIVTNLIQESAVPIIKSNIELNEEQEKQLEALFEDEEVNKLVENIVGQVLEDLGSEDGKIDPSVVDYFFDYVIENKDKIEEVAGNQIDISELESLKNSDDYKDFSIEITNSINEATGELDDNTKMVIKAYSYFVSNDFKYLVIGMIVIDLLLIALIQWSIYKWLIVLGRAMTITGLSLLLFSIFVSSIINVILAENNITLDIDMSNLTNLSIISLIVGLLLIIIPKVIEKIIEKNKSTEEIDTNIELNNMPKGD